MALMTFDTHDTYGGYIYFTGLAYSYYDDTNGLVANEFITGIREARGFTSFDTSALPDNADIVSAQLDIEYYNQESGGPDAPSSWTHRVYGAKDLLDGSLGLADWNDLRWTLMDQETPVEGTTTYYFSGKDLDQINLTGHTDFTVRDNSGSQAPGGYWAISYYNCGNRRAGQLKVYYNLPRIFNAKLYNCKLHNA